MPFLQYCSAILPRLLVEDHDVVPLGALLALAALLVAPGLGRGDAHVHHLVARIEPPHFRVGAEVADQDHFVDAARHGDLLNACVFRAGSPTSPAALVAAVADRAAAVSDRGYSRPGGAPSAATNSPTRRARRAETSRRATCPQTVAAAAWEPAPLRLH